MMMQLEKLTGKLHTTDVTVTVTVALTMRHFTLNTTFSAKATDNISSRALMARPTRP